MLENLRNRKHLELKAQSKQKGYNARKQESRRMEIRKLNEAIQYLVRKRNKSDKTMQDWKDKSKRQLIVTKALEALALDDSTAHMRTDEYREAAAKERQMKEMESKRAQALADELANTIDEAGVVIDEKEKLKE